MIDTIWTLGAKPFAFVGASRAIHNPWLVIGAPNASPDSAEMGEIYLVNLTEFATGTQSSFNVDAPDTRFSAFPNPFHSQITFQFVPHFRQTNRESVNVRIYDLLGRSVFENEQVYFGDIYACTWNPVGLAPGVYVAQFSAGGMFIARKILYLP